MMKSSIVRSIDEIENRFNADYISELKQGHTGCYLLKFRKRTDDDCFVVKMAESSNTNAVEEIKNNIRGYEQIKASGGTFILPQYSIHSVDGATSLVMDYLDADFASYVRKFGIKGYELLVSFYDEMTQKPLFESKGLYVPEVLRYTIFFAQQTPSLFDLNFYKNLKRWSSDLQSERDSLFLLDFTPDNLFIQNDQIIFIDPWSQSTYVGCPIISLGQFVTLAKDIYSLPASIEGARLIQNFCQTVLSARLGISEIIAQKMFLLGQVLQYVLSASVRGEKNKLGILFASRATAIVD